jgi:hypothetical protein
MKKLLIGSVLSMAAISGMVSCQSTKYDANPNADQNYAMNPLDTANHAVMISSMKGKIDGAWIVLSPAYYTVDTNSIRHIYASVRNDSVYTRIFKMDCSNDAVKKTKDNLNHYLDEYTLSYSVYDTVIKKRREYKLVATPTDYSSFKLKVVIDEDKDGGMKGYFSGPVSLVLPEPGNPNDIVTFDSMYFYFDKRK